MKIRAIVSVLAIVVSMPLLFTGCVTLISGFKEKVKIVTNVQGANIRLNGKPVLSTFTQTNTVTLKKSVPVYTVEISKPGYDTVRFKLNPIERPFAMSAGYYEIYLGIIAVPLIYFVTFDPGLGTTPSIGDIRARNLSWFVAGALIAAGAVDLTTDASKTYMFRKIQTSLPPIGLKFETALYNPIRCDEVKLGPGVTSDVGKVYAFHAGSFYAASAVDLDWTGSKELERLKWQSNLSMERAGLDVAGAGKKTQVMFRPPRFKLTAVINRVEMAAFQAVGKSFYYMGREVGSSKEVKKLCGEINVSFTITDNKTQKIVYLKQATFTHFSDNNDVREVLEMCYRGAMRHVVSDSSLMQVLISKNDTSTAFGGEKLTLKTPDPVADLQASMKAALTVSVSDGYCSGVMISSDGYFLTSYRSIKDKGIVSVLFENGISLDANMVRYDEETDLALMKVSGRGFSALRFSSEMPKIGQEVYAIGSPESIELDQSISKGIVSARRKINGLLFIQTDVKVNQGSYGGPFCNSNNELLGMIASKAVGLGIEGIAFAVPRETIEKALNIQFQ